MLLEESEGFFTGHNNCKLALRKWEVQNPKATLFITHGQAEHSDCYQRLAEGLNEHLPIHVIAWDLRGHGKSDGRRGHADSFDDYVADYEYFLKEAYKIAATPKNIFLLGHSMGGLIQSIYLSQTKKINAKAQILSSPLFGLSLPVPKWKKSGADLIDKFLPFLTLSNEIKFSDLTKDPAVIEEYKKDSYRHNKISPQVFLGFQSYFEQATSLAQSIKLPTYMCVSNRDPIISTESALEFLEHLDHPDKSLNIVDNGKHELFNDLERNQVYQSVSRFIAKHIKEG